MFSRATDRKLLCFLSEISYDEVEDKIPTISRFLSAYLGDQESLGLLVKEGLTSYDNLESSFFSYLDHISTYVEYGDLSHFKLSEVPPRLVLKCVLEKLRQETIDFTALCMFIFNFLEGEDVYREELLHDQGLFDDSKPFWYVQSILFGYFQDFCSSSDPVFRPNTLDVDFYEESSLIFDYDILYFIACFACSENKELISRFLSAYLGDQESLDSLVKEGLTSYDNLESSFLSYLRSDSVSGHGGGSSSIYLFDREVLYFCDKIFYYPDIARTVLQDLLYIYVDGLYDHILEWMIINGFVESASTFSTDFRKLYSEVLYKKGGFRLCMRL